MAAAPDYCTGFPDEVAGVVIAGCCHAHDLAYEAGGTLADFFISNLSLGACIAAQSDSPVLLLIGVASVAATSTVGLAFWVRAAWRRKNKAG